MALLCKAKAVSNQNLNPKSPLQLVCKQGKVPVSNSCFKCLSHKRALDLNKWSCTLKIQTGICDEGLNRKRSLYQFAKAAVTKYHRLGNNRNSFSHNFGGQKSQIKISTGLVSFEAFLFGLQMGHLIYMSSQGPAVLVQPPLIRTSVTMD